MRSTARQPIFLAIHPEMRNVARKTADDCNPTPELLVGLRAFNVQGAARKPLVDFMVSALESAGCTILFCSGVRTAPFVISFETAAGERMGAVAYAFLATRTPTKNRPEDERSFQIKYGSKRDNRAHRLWSDPLGLYTTLLVGIDPEEEFFVAADPAIHNPTRLFIRLEFKDEHAEQIQSRGWYAWERVKRGGHAEPIEVLVGGTKNHFLDLIRFERAAANLPPGDRQLLAEKPEVILAPPLLASGAPLTVSPQALHPLVQEFSLSPEQIFELIANARRLKMAVRGWVAEQHLFDALRDIPGVTRCERLDTDGSPDIRLSYRGGDLLTIECKNVLRKVDQANNPRVDFQRTRASKRDPCSRYYAPSDFDIVAGCLHAVTEEWKFRYALTSQLQPHNKCKGKLASNVRIDSSWAADPTVVFNQAYAELSA
jgi:hypothetical protein